MIRLPPTRKPRVHRVGREHRLYPTGGSWGDLAEQEPDSEMEAVYLLLHMGLMEAWQDNQGRIRFYDAKTGQEWRS